MGSSSKSSNKTSTKYQTQNISAPGAERIAGGNMTITETSKPALLLVGQTINGAMALSENAIKSADKTARDINAKALDTNLATTNAALDTVGDTVELSYRQTTNQAQNIKAMTAKALDEVAQASRPDSEVNNKLLIKGAVIVGSLALIAGVLKKGKK